MGKRIIQQRRGKGSRTYRVRRKAYLQEIKYPSGEGKARVLKLISSAGHTAPLAKIIFQGKAFYNPAFKGMIEGQEIEIGGEEVKEGNILALKNIPVEMRVYNIETRAKDGGKIIRTSGNSAVVKKKVEDKVVLLLPSKKEVWFNGECRATIGTIAGHGRLEKPFMKAGKKYYLMKARNKLWPRTSAVKMNIVAHPFGSGRGKRIKGKVPKRNAPPGAKVGSLSPRRTGRRKK